MLVENSLRAGDNPYNKPTPWDAQGVGGTGDPQRERIFAMYYVV